jgi:hypothetical protein
VDPLATAEKSGEMASHIVLQGRPVSCKWPRVLLSRALIGWVLLGCASIAGAAGGCSGGEDTATSTSGFDGGLATSSSGGAGGAPGETARDKFDAIEADLVEACGACHQAQGSADAPFLAEPDRYSSITSWPLVIVPNPDESVLITHPADPNHGTGQAPDMPADLAPRVLDWLEKEASELPSPDADAGPQIPPFKPFVAGAFNTIYLDPLGGVFANMSISFNAEELGGTPGEPSMLSITDLTVHPVGTTTLHIVHPLFTVYPPDAPADPDPVDSFSNVDQTFSLQSDLRLGTGDVVLTNWAKDSYLGIAFEVIEVYGAGTDAGLTDCKDVDGFQSAVVPAMQYCMSTCHGGANAQANATMDLSKLNEVPPNEACLQVRARITPGDPASSQLLIVTNPSQQAVHMYKFLGNTNKYNEFKTKVSPWIEAEQ